MPTSFPGRRFYTSPRSNCLCGAMGRTWNRLGVTCMHAAVAGMSKVSWGGDKSTRFSLALESIFSWVLGKIGTREEAKEGRAEAAKGGSKGSWGTCRRGARRREFSCRAACSEVAVRLERKVCHVRVGYWFRSRRCVQGRECKELRWGCVVLGGQRKSGGAKTRSIRRQVLQTGTVVGDLQSTLLPVFHHHKYW